MNSNIYMSNQNNILMKSMTKEEILIKSLIEEIQDAEKKISEINNNENNIQNGFYNNNIKINELQDFQKNLNKKIISLNNEFQIEYALKQEEISKQKNEINELDLKLIEYQNKISKINLSDINFPLFKYLNEKNNENKILTKEEINEILLNKKENKENIKLKELMKELEICKASENVILNNKKQYELNLNKYNENIKMLKEEKIIIKEELIDIISYKETLESINKNNIINLVKSINNQNEKNDFNNKDIIKIYFFEFEIIDMNIIPNKLYEELSSSFSLIINNNNNYKKNIYYTRSQSKEIYTIEIYDKKKINNNNINNNKNKSLNNSYINSFHDNNFFDKNSFEDLIQKELNSFLNNNNKEFNIINLLNNISLIIINEIKKNEIEIPLDFNDNLVIYLSYFFKILYYDKIIKNNLKFINKEYKSIKKDYKKAKDIINNEISKLNNKLDEIKNKKIENENNLIIIKNTKINNEGKFILSQTEQLYIQICSEINSLNEKKSDVKNNIINIENEINNKKIEKNNKIENINSEIEKLKQEINDMNNINELIILKNNEDIINYRKIIAEKFNIIKEQLQIYKQKYGTNISLYNKFINKLNNNIQKTRNKEIIYGIEYLNDFKLNNKKLYKNNSFNKSFINKKNKNEINGLELSENWNKTSNNIKQSYTPCNKNNSSNKLIFNYDNKSYNFINNIRIEKTNYSFNNKSSTISYNNENKRRKKISTKKNSNSRIKNNVGGNNFEIINKNDFDINNFISKKDENSKTFSHSFFRRQNKKIKNNNNNNGILNINLLKLKNNIPKCTTNTNNKLSKLLPLTKITFCYFREINSQNLQKFNPLLNISSKELCEYPYNFIKSTISLSKNYKKIRIVPSTQLEPIDFEINMIENTIVSTGIKSIIDIYRNYYKEKLPLKGNNFDKFISEQIDKYNNLSKEDIKKCVLNKNFNFSLVLKNEKKRFEFIICSYDEFKMWINGMAFIIKNKEQIFKLINDN